MSGPKRGDFWGLRVCRPDLQCGVCMKLTNQPGAMQRLRDCFCVGIHEELLAVMFGVPSRDLHGHVWRRGWLRRKNWSRASMDRAVELLLWQRLAASWHLFSPSTADRMLDLLMRLNFKK